MKKKHVVQLVKNRVRLGCGVISVISKRFAKSEFQILELNFEFGAINKQTVKLLQTSSQHQNLS